MKLSNKVYKTLNWISLVVLDAVGVFYKTIAEIWMLPFGNEILATCAALSLLLGALIGVTSVTYNKNMKEGNETDADVTR